MQTGRVASWESGHMVDWVLVPRPSCRTLLRQDTLEQGDQKSPGTVYVPDTYLDYLTLPVWLVEKRTLYV